MKAKIKKDWYDRIKNADEIHYDSKLWLSEIGFIKDEIRFLEHLLSSNYINFLEYGLTKKVSDFVKKIVEEKKTGSILYKLLKNHEKMLSNLIDTNSVTTNTNYLDKHKKLEFEIFIYFKKYKKLKRKIFRITEEVIKKRKQKSITA